MATSSSKCQDSRQLTPLRDTRAQLFVGNLPYRVRWQDLKDLFRRAGTVLRADVSLGPDNRSRGYGTVLLATAEDAGRAIDMLNGYCWQTRVLEVRPDRLGASVDEMGGSLAIRGANGHPPGLGNPYDEITLGQDGVGGTGMKTLFLPFHIQWQDLKDLFRAAGAVARADVTVGPDGRSRGFGTVSFVTEDGAERARRMFDGCVAAFIIDDAPSGFMCTSYSTRAYLSLVHIFTIKHFRCIVVWRIAALHALGTLQCHRVLLFHSGSCADCS
ncbi:RNA-binding domain-containing protein [Suillus weaverae]|nr:RNA-binding domain-containing protein [Suillus weaverae]